MLITPIDRAGGAGAGADAGAAGVAGARARARAWLAWALAGGAMLGGALVLRVWRFSNDPNATICLFRRLTHHDCATCGMTRALALLARGDLAGAFARHPLAPPLAAEALLLWLAAPIAIARGTLPAPALRDRWLIAHAGAFLLLWVVRLAA